MNTDLNVQTTLTSMSHRGFLLKDENGKPWEWFIQDITKRKEEELRLKLLETVIVQTKESIIITEADWKSNFQNM
jgi:hypothetical protein